MDPEDLCSLIRNIITANYNENGKGYVLNESKLLSLISQITALLDCEPALLQLDGTFKIVGDLHGDIISLLRIFDKFGYPSADNRYLFLGDYVDRGNNSLEVLELLFALKLLFPTYLFMLKGNHECTDICSHYGFLSECKKRSTEQVFSAFCETFVSLPICAILSQRALCVHGGISQYIKSKGTLERLEKCDIPEPDSIVADILWSDPSDDVNEYGPSKRQIGHVFGPKAVSDICEMLDVFVVIRAHEFAEAGYETNFGVMTVFSSADYCGQGNTAAVLTVSEDAMIESEIEIDLIRPLIKTKFHPAIPHFVSIPIHDSISIDDISLDVCLAQSLCS